MNTPALPSIQLKTDRVPGHPWVWSAQIVKPEERLPPGSVVDVLLALIVAAPLARSLQRKGAF